MKTSLQLAACALAAGAAATAGAQLGPTYPAKPIRVVVGFTAGGGTDSLTRLVSQKMSESLGQAVVVENRVGASGIISAEFVAKASPDGYTLLAAPSTVFTINPVMYTKLPYSPVQDFVPVSKNVTFPFVLIVDAAAPIRSLGELVAYMKANPAKANYGGSSGLFQLALEMFRQRTGTRIEYVPYKGSNEAIAAVMSGNLLMTLVDTGPATGPLKGNKVRGLAVTSGERLALFPDIPTMAQAGISGMEIEGWMGMFAPAATPAAIVRRLEAEANRAVKLPELRERLTALQLVPAGIGTEAFVLNIRADLERWRVLAKTAGIKPVD